MINIKPLEKELRQVNSNIKILIQLVTVLIEYTAADLSLAQKAVLNERLENIANIPMFIGKEE